MILCIGKIAAGLISGSIAIVLVLVLAIAIKIWQAMFNISVGKRINSVALSATGADSRNDVISTGVVLISVVFGKVTGPTHTNIIFDVVASHDCDLTPAQIRQAFDQAVKAVKSSYFTVVQIDKQYTRSVSHNN